MEEKREEREMRQKGLETEAMRAEREAEAEERRMEREAMQMMERLKLEHELRLKELEVRDPSGEDGEGRLGDVGQVMGARHQDDFFWLGKPKCMGMHCIMFCLKCPLRVPNSHIFLDHREIVCNVGGYWRYCGQTFYTIGHCTG